MNKPLYPITDVIAKAIQPGPVTGPTALLTALATEDSPFKALMRSEGTDAIGTAIELDFGFLRGLHKLSDDACDDTIGRWAALIRWLLETTNGWQHSTDERLVTLAAALLTSSLSGSLWHLLLDKHVPSEEFITTISALIEKMQLTYGVRGPKAPPIWENEFAEAFRKADADGDWADIAAMWSQFDHVVRPDILLREMARCLARFDISKLAQATNGLQHCPLVMQVASALAVNQRLRLANVSSSERVRFCCAFVSVTERQGRATLSNDEEAGLTDLLVKVAETPEEWRKWMTAFNTFPLRYPPLHRPLGSALARVSQDAAKFYINSIKLHPIKITNHDESRALISDCLRVFRQQAAPEHWQAVWSYAHQLWRDWRFDAKDKTTNLFEINHSPFDFAIYSYASECMSAVECEKILMEITKEIQKIGQKWHASLTDLTTELNRLLSLIQPYAHACNITESNKFTRPDSRAFYPPELLNYPYYGIMYRLQKHSMSVIPNTILTKTIERPLNKQIKRQIKSATASRSWPSK